MTDIVERAARVLCEANGGNPDYTPKSYVNGIATGEVNDPLWVDYIDEAQALADAGLLRDPARTVPTRRQIAAAVGGAANPTQVGIGVVSITQATDAVLELLADQPTVEDVRDQAVAEDRLRRDSGARIPLEALLADQPTVAEAKAQALADAAHDDVNANFDHHLLNWQVTEDGLLYHLACACGIRIETLPQWTAHVAAEAKARALEEAADYWENETHQKIVPTWLRERAQQIRDGK